MTGLAPVNPLNQRRPSPRRFLTGVLGSIAGIVIGVIFLVAVGVYFDELAVDAGVYTPNMSPGTRLAFVPLFVALIALVALPVDLILENLAYPRALSNGWQSTLLGLSYSLFAMPMGIPRSGTVIETMLALFPGPLLVAVWLVLPTLAALLVRFFIARKISGVEV